MVSVLGQGEPSVALAEAAAGVWFGDVGGDEAGVGGRRLYVVRTRSRQEKALSEDLASRGIEHFLPLVRQVRYYGRRKAAVMEPLFSGYLFLHGDVEATYRAERTGRVAQVLRVSDQRGLARELAQVWGALSGGGVLSACRPMERGVLVEVTGGPLKGVRGTVEGTVRDDRLVLNVGMIAQAAQLEIDRSLLRPVTEG